VRQQPEWQLCLQNGRFDQANRLFHSVLDTWNNCMHLDSDVKELIPEFYDTNLNASSFLCNRLELDLGTRQDGVRVNDVILPKWASSPKEFVQKMRDALESSYVSENLHSWIDLIFGYKQRGEEALKADNLFYYLCYEGSVDLNSIKNYAERKSLEVQIQEFGQIPTLLFKTPHLARFKLTDMVEPTFRLNHELEMANVLKPLKNIIKSHVERDNNSLTKTNHPSLNFKDLTINLVLKSHHKSQINDCVFLNLNSEAGTDSTIKMPVIATVSSDNCLKMYSLEDRSLFRSHKVSNFSISSIDFADFATADQPGKNLLLFLSCWDNSVYVYSETYNRCIQKLDDLHEDAISRVRVLGKNSSSTFLLTASWDSLIKLWSMNNRTYRTKCLNEICHDSACLDFSISRSYLAIICKDGNLYMWKANSKLLEESDSANDEEDDEYDDSDQQLVKNEKDYFTYLFSIQNSNDIGQINDAFILEQPDDRVRATPNCTLAVCTSFGFVKIFNIENNTDLFSLKINIGDPARPDAASYNLKKILYSLDYIVTVDSSGYIYFVDLKQDQLITNTTTASTFLAHHLQVAPCSISSLCFHHDLNLFSLGDMDGNLYLISSDHLK
jgi:factor associated with neutral sphingomyelinase activation